MSESTYPYVENVEHDYHSYNTDDSLLCAFNEDKVVGKINRIVEIPEGDEEALMEAVANKVDDRDRCTCIHFLPRKLGM